MTRPKPPQTSRQTPWPGDPLRRTGRSVLERDVPQPLVERRVEVRVAGGVEEPARRP